ncbi:MAG TPA: class I SAM-dependent methyltransferase [Acidimicrobiales bacterium]|nr:class I SAM-dependent methyltransferase [Acidimicrobiales bacterium]
MFSSSAPLYDAIYAALGKDYAAESDELVALVARRRPSAMTWLDVACGTGAHLEYLCRRFDVVGVDLDPAMLACASERLPGVALYQADYRTLALGRTFDVVSCLFGSIGYAEGAADLRAAVGSMAAHLAPGGVLIVDAWLRPEEWRDGVVQVVVAEDGPRRIVRVGRSRLEGEHAHLEMHHLVADEGGVEYLVEHHDLTLFTPEAYESALRNAGLAPEVVAAPTPGRDRYVAVAPSPP